MFLAESADLLRTFTLDLTLDQHHRSHLSDATPAPLNIKITTTTTTTAAEMCYSAISKFLLGREAEEESAGERSPLLSPASLSAPSPSPSPPRQYLPPAPMHLPGSSTTSASASSSSDDEESAITAQDFTGAAAEDWSRLRAAGARESAK
ncbi:hypothetical protein LTR53_002968 [Teratosphaeriaceae sp. CCFEE 6253]|nr:hypothetical protein LTR53_002968 [Teratosphaeriaceae sp. CCFEE 6253]